MQALKILVALMGVLILIGFGVVGTEIYKRLTDPNRRSEAAERPLPLEPLQLPAGSRISDLTQIATANGSKVLFRVSLPAGGDRLYLLDPRSGATAIVAGAAGEP